MCGGGYGFAATVWGVIVAKESSKTVKPPNPGRGGRRENAGRKAQDGMTRADGVMITALVTPAQRGRYLALGGSAWLRAMIDREFDKQFD